MYVRSNRRALYPLQGGDDDDASLPDDDIGVMFKTKCEYNFYEKSYTQEKRGLENRKGLFPTKESGGAVNLDVYKRMDTAGGQLRCIGNLCSSTFFFLHAGSLTQTQTI